MVELNDQDYMVPLRAFVTFAAAFATPRDPFQRYSVLVGTHAAATLRPQVGLTALVALWMDDFDANTALSKLNRTSVFAVVATVLLVDLGVTVRPARLARPQPGWWTVDYGHLVGHLGRMLGQSAGRSAKC
jgi:hypothetical protein